MLDASCEPRHHLRNPVTFTRIFGDLQFAR
jgi:hypothetical protein